MARNAASFNANSAKAQAASAVDQLFGVSEGEQVASGLKLIQHDQIEVKPQPRTSFAPGEISELARSIAELRERGEGIEGSGILQPLLVTALPQPRGTARYRLVAGERRYRASQEAGLELVPCLVVVMRDDAVLIAQLIENIQRQDLGPLEGGQAFQKLCDEQGLSLRDIARSIGKSLGYVTNRYGLLKRGPDVQEMVFLRKNTLMHAQYIDVVTDGALRRELIRAVVEEDIPIKEVQRRIEAATARTALPVTPPSSTVSATKLPATRIRDSNRPSGPSHAGNLVNDTSTGSLGDSVPDKPVDPLDQSVLPAIASLAEALRKTDVGALMPADKKHLIKVLGQIKKLVGELEKSVR